jgi:hypothetical protein
VVKVKSKEYEFNVYVVDGMVRLSAYEMKYLDNPENQEPKEKPEMADGTEPTELDLRAEAIEGWQDYDSWEGGEDWYNGLPTQRLKDWVDGLPEYEPEPSHEWSMTTAEVFDQLRRSPERPVYADVKCLNCDETYQVGKVW